MPRKTQQLQIRVTQEQKRTLKRLAAEADMDVSSWVLSRALPRSHDRFQELTAELAKGDDRSYALAELADYLRALPVREFQRAVAFPPKAKLDAATRNHLAGMIELAS